MAKTLTFAATHFTVAFTIAWLLTGDVLLGGTIALVEPMVNTVAYYFHEKIWLRLASKKPATQDLITKAPAVRLTLCGFC